MTKTDDDRKIQSAGEVADLPREYIPDIAKNLHDMAINASRSTSLRLSAVKTILDRADIMRSHLRQEQFDAVSASLGAIVADAAATEGQREAAQRHLQRGHSLYLWA